VVKGQRHHQRIAMAMSIIGISKLFFIRYRYPNSNFAAFFSGTVFASSKRSHAV